jgi:hypothetical protein
MKRLISIRTRGVGIVKQEQDDVNNDDDDVMTECVADVD